jgi:NAD+ diphosphatase
MTTTARDDMSSFFDGLPEKEASKFNGFAGNVIDRQSEHRNAQSVAAALADKTARLYLFAEEKAIYRPGTPPDPLFSVSEAKTLGALETEVVLLGWAREGPRLAATLSASAVGESDGFRVLDLRSLAMEGAMPPDHLGAFAQARSLSSWHQRHQFCANCGTKTEMVSGGYRRDCAACKTQHFPRTDPVAIMLVIKGERCIMARKPMFVPGMYACLAGFIEPGETIEDAVRRETREESGIAVGRVRYFASQPWPFPSTLMIGCHCEALSEEITRDEAELEDCRWFERADVRRMIAGTHPDGLMLTNPIAIGNRIISAWATADG